MRDYPAAHSMDSTWFAVDSTGEIAFFDTGEGGCMPEGFPAGGEAGGYGDDSLEASDMLAAALLLRAKKDERLRALLPADEATLRELLDDIDYELRERLLRRVGIWTYDCHEAIAYPYVRSGQVTTPLTVDTLDAATRAHLADATLPVQFSSATSIAPGEFVPVFAWGSLWIDLEGQAHPTADADVKDFEVQAASYLEYDDDFELDPPQTHEIDGDEFYDLLEEQLAAARQWADAPAPPDDVNDKEGFVAWLTSLFKRKR